MRQQRNGSANRKSRADLPTRGRYGASGSLGESRYAAGHDPQAPDDRRHARAASRLRRAARSAPSSSRKAEAGFAPKPLVKAKHHMVVAAHPLAAEAGLAMLRKGGSAVDAGIATQMVLNLVEPQSSGDRRRRLHPLLGQAEERAGRASTAARPRLSAATPELFLDKDGKPLARDAAMASGLSVGVPGVLAALKLAHDKYGKLPWAELFRAGHRPRPRRLRRLAAPRQAARRGDPESFAPEARAYFFDAEGKPWPAGHHLDQSSARRHARHHRPRGTRRLL